MSKHILLPFPEESRALQKPQSWTASAPAGHLHFGGAGFKEYSRDYSVKGFAIALHLQMEITKKHEIIDIKKKKKEIKK